MRPQTPLASEVVVLTALPPRSEAERGEVRRAALVVATVIVLLAGNTSGCTLLTSLDGLSGGDAGSSNDAAIDAAVDAAIDAAVADSGPGDTATVDGACQADPCPLELARAGRPAGLTVDGDHVYFIDRQPPVMLRVPKVGGRTEQVVDGLLSDPFDVALDAVHVYWSEHDGNRVWRRARTGGDPEVAFAAAGRAGHLAAGDGMVFVTDDSAVGSVAVGPVAGASSALLYPGQGFAAGIAFDGRVLYWGRRDPAVVAAGTPQGGPSPPAFAGSDGEVSGVALLAGDAIVWMSGGQEIVRVSTSGQGRAVLHRASNPFGPGDVAADEGAVYWTEPDAGRIMKLAR